MAAHTEQTKLYAKLRMNNLLTNGVAVHRSFIAIYSVDVFDAEERAIKIAQTLNWILVKTDYGFSITKSN